MFNAFHLFNYFYLEIIQFNVYCLSPWRERKVSFYFVYVLPSSYCYCLTSENLLEVNC